MLGAAGGRGGNKKNKKYTLRVCPLSLALQQLRIRNRQGYRQDVRGKGFRSCPSTSRRRGAENAEKIGAARNRPSRVAAAAAAALLLLLLLLLSLLLLALDITANYYYTLLGRPTTPGTC